ncbi:MAG TPA: glycine zipper 2TM domain-containing protein [Novosphingobium sp.]|jgi:hypothetical protein|nr:glycine zipper 2TM domain-containing protein [Novosphingobium sp.]
MTLRFKTALLALAVPGAMAAATPAFADGDHYRDGYRGDQYRGDQHRGEYRGDYRRSDTYRGDYGRGDRYGSGWNGYRGSYGGAYNGNYGRYDGRYGEPVYASTRVWRGDNGNYYCRRKDGTTGLLVGGAVGALLGHEVAGRRGDRTLGALLGGAAGALLGREIDRGDSRCR